MVCNLSWNLGILICGVLILYTGKVIAGDFTISPQRIFFGGQNPTSEMNFSCTPTTLGMNYLLGFDIGKVSPDGTQSTVTKREVLYPVKTGNFMSNGTGERDNNFFYVKGDTGYLKYYLRELRCSDIGTYYCTSTMMGSGSFPNVTVTSTRKETVKVADGHDGIKMTILPDKKAYDVNENVEFKCSGVISSKFDEYMVKHWVWERMENKRWTTFRKSDKRINHSIPNPATNCTFHSTLTYRIESTDHGRQFRCYLKDRENIANKTVSLVEFPVGNSGKDNLAKLFQNWTDGMIGAGNTKEISIALLVSSVMMLIFFQS